MRVFPLFIASTWPYSQATDSQLTILSLSSVQERAKGIGPWWPPFINLFSLTLEPLAMQLNASDSVTEFEVGGTEEKLYADDTLLYFGDTSSSLRRALQIINKFRTVSGI